MQSTPDVSTDPSRFIGTAGLASPALPDALGRGIPPPNRWHRWRPCERSHSTGPGPRLGRTPLPRQERRPDRADCHDSRMTKKWCLGCQDWVEPDKRRIALEREGGSGMERRPSPVVEVCPKDDGAASGAPIGRRSASLS
jgi:hypothetical protein